MDRRKRGWLLAGCGLSLVMAVTGCRSPRSEVPPGRQFLNDGRQAPGVGFSSEPRPGTIGGAFPNGAPGNPAGATIPSTPPGTMFGAPTENSYGPPATTSGAPYGPASGMPPSGSVPLPGSPASLGVPTPPSAGMPAAGSAGAPGGPYAPLNGPAAPGTMGSSSALPSPM